MLQTATTVIPLQQQTVDSTGGQDDEGRDLASTHNACSNGHRNANTRNTPRRRIRLHLVLEIENGPDWAHSSVVYQTWSDAWNQWMTETNFARWPLWDETPSSSVILGGPLTARATKHQRLHGASLLVSTQQVEEEFGCSIFS